MTGSAGEAGQPVLVARRDDTGLDAHALAAPHDDDPEVGDGLREVDPEDLLRPEQRGGHRAPGTDVRVAVAGDPRRLPAGVAEMDSRHAEDGRSSSEGGSLDAQPERDAADVGAARQPDEPRHVSFGGIVGHHGQELERTRDGDGGGDRESGTGRGRDRLDVTSQTPAPPPASASSTCEATAVAGRTSPKETDAGEASTSGTSRVHHVGEAAAAHESECGDRPTVLHGSS